MHVAPRAASVWQLDRSVVPISYGTLQVVSKADGIDVDTLDAVASCTGPKSTLAGFPREHRIVKTDEFSSVFNLRPVFRTAHFVLYARPTSLPNARLGVVAAKRLAPRAVTRNTVKRMTRELFRQTPLPPIDCIVRLSKPVNTKTGPATAVGLKQVLRAELVQLFSGQRLRNQTPPI